MERDHNPLGTDKLGSERHSESEGMHKLLRGEISAVEAYRQVLEKVKEDPEVARLETFLRDHQQAVDYWRSQIGASGDLPDADSGPWGSVVEAFTGASKLLGNTAALQTLKQGENIGLSNYRDLLDDEDISPAHKEKVRDTFIPNQERHITSIDAMMKLH